MGIFSGIKKKLGSAGTKLGKATLGKVGITKKKVFGDTLDSPSVPEKTEAELALEKELAQKAKDTEALELDARRKQELRDKEEQLRRSGQIGFKSLMSNLFGGVR